MNRCIAGFVVAVGLCVGTGDVASAADIAPAAPVYVKAPVAIPYSWTGFYAGGNLGYGWGNGDQSLSVSESNEPFSAGLTQLLNTTTAGTLKFTDSIARVGVNYKFNLCSDSNIRIPLQPSPLRMLESKDHQQIHDF